MPQQEVFFRQQAGDRFIAVLKTYDRSYPRVVFAKVDDEALKIPASALKIEKDYDLGDVPALTTLTLRFCKDHRRLQHFPDGSLCWIF